jgi:hypothetical protein
MECAELQHAREHAIEGAERAAIVQDVKGIVYSSGKYLCARSAHAHRPDAGRRRRMCGQSVCNAPHVFLDAAEAGAS